MQERDENDYSLNSWFEAFDMLEIFCSLAVVVTGLLFLIGRAVYLAAQ